ncbi:MAG: RDD family protein [Lysobacter sp.]|nr:RDD family protein [Lysobacter sp.]
MDEHNPYSASSAAIAASPEKLDIRSTGKWRRFFNWLIDIIAIMVLTFLIAFAAAVVGGDAVGIWIEQMDQLTESAISYALFALYYVFMEGTFGFTIGKLITNTRVVDEYGRPPGFVRALWRTLARFIPFEPLSLLFGDERGWHDTLPRTYVIDRPRNGAPAGRVRHSISGQFGEQVLPQSKPVVDPAP